jgi:CubicO group peptidase (beta-lactamase class C family)
MPFDARRMARKIEDQVVGRVVGYQFAIYEGETLAASGGGGAAVKSPFLPMTADHRMTIASMSKTITAIACLRALEIVNAGGPAYTGSPNGLSVDSLIAPWLPHNWVRGPHVNEMTFRHLLTHRSGLRKAVPGIDEDLFDSLRQTVANGATDQNWQMTAYDNNNFSLLRVLIANLLYGVAVSGTSLPPGETPDRYTARLHYHFVRDQVLGRVGLQHVSMAPYGPQEANVYYDFVDGSTYTDPDLDWHMLRAGAGHWFMSARELARLIAGFRHGRIVAAATVQMMLDNDLGTNAIDYATTGRNWSHSGGFETTTGAGMDGDWVMLPEGVTAVCMVNSTRGLRKPLWDTLCTSFNAAKLTPATTVSRPAAAAFSTRLHVFARAADNRPYSNAARDGQPFGGWFEVEGWGATVHGPSAVGFGDRLYVAATMDQQVKVNSALENQWFEGFGSFWTALPGMTTDAAPALATLGSRLYVFAKSLNGRLHVASAPLGGAFGPWQEVQGNGTTDAAPAAVSLSNRIYVFAKGVRDRQVYVNSAVDGQPFDGWGSGWAPIPGLLTDAAPAAAMVSNRLFVVAKRTDGRVFTASATHGSGFGSWTEVSGGVVTNVPPAAAGFNGRLYVVTARADTGRILVASASGAAVPSFGSWTEVQW